MAAQDDLKEQDGRLGVVGGRVELLHARENPGSILDSSSC